MSRLADYFAVVGIDKGNENGLGELKGKVLQRFPKQDRKDAPFPEGIELFCQPGGWTGSFYTRPPTFFVSVLTDMEGNHRYCACFTFYESFTPSSASVLRQQRDDSLSDTSSVRTSSQTASQPVINVSSASDETYPFETFVPKCLCLVSRVTFFDILKNCLLTIYQSFVSGNTNLLERLVGTVLGFVHVPPPGGPKLTFSIGAGDRQSLCPPESETLPVTNKSVAMLFNQLGIHNMLCLYSAAVTENKILFISSSYSLLTSATQALLALMYPLKFSYVYIPILPAALLDFLSAPTPYIMGVHENYKNNIPELSDVIHVDIDGGHISVPDTINLATLPEPYLSRTRHELNMVMNPQIMIADHAFPVMMSLSPPTLQDKEIRAIFMRLVANLYSGYRSCLTLIRIHPKPVITFNKDSFLEQRGMIGEEFFTKILDSIAFTTFVAKRGPPYRPCDLFDEIYAEIDETLTSEHGLDPEIQANIQHLAQKLFHNEPSSETSENNMISSSMVPVNSKQEDDKKVTFPMMDESVINQFIKEEETHVADIQVKPRDPMIVPHGNTSSMRQQHFIHSRKLEVLKDCVAYIFDNKISEARKALPSVQRSLRSKGAQLALCHELSLRAKQHRSVLEHDQFDLIVKLMNTALQDDSSLNNTLVAASLLPLSATFCRKLATGVIQFAYTCVQEHDIWNSQQFWEEAFYADVQSQIKQLYVDEEAPKANAEDTSEKQWMGNTTPLTKHHSFTGSSTNIGSRSSDSAIASGSEGRSTAKVTQTKQAPSALRIAAKQLKQWPTMSNKEKESMISSEESIVYSQAIHYANRMVYMRIPLNVSELMPRTKPNQNLAPLSSIPSTGTPRNDHESVSGLYTDSGVISTTGGSYMDTGGSITDSYAMEVDDDEEGTIADQISKFVLKFVDRVGSEAGIKTEHLKSLYAMIPGVVAMHIESLEPVYREYKQLAPIRKAKVMKPALIPGEEMQFEGLRCYLMADGRELGKGEYGGPILLPAEGALFLTNYRVIFKGTPVDQFASEIIITRSFPVGSLLKEKKINVQYIPRVEQWLHECIQLRSSTFQVMKLAFDEEVGTEKLDLFRKRIHKLRYPATVFSTFAFTGKGVARTPTMVVQRYIDRQGTLKKTRAKLMANATRHKGTVVGLKGSVKRKKYSLKHRRDGSKSPDARRAHSPSGSVDTEDGSLVDLDDIPLRVEAAPVHGIEILSKMPCCQDYCRLGFGNLLRGPSTGPWRTSMVNITYTGCRSYPAVLVVPQVITDDTLLRVSRNHCQGRFPVALWKHSRTKAVLLRAGGFERSAVASFIKSGMTGGSISVGHRSIPSTSAEQEKFLNAIVNATPVSKSKSVARANSLHHGILLRDGTTGYQTIEDLVQGELVDRTIMKKGWEPAALYVFGDKARLRNIKQENYPKCEFIPIELPDVRAVRGSFKKFQRACCPSGAETDVGYISLVQESEWLQQLSAIMNCAGAAVDLLDIQGSSVLVCFEDGWDVTSQVVSLAEIMLDPYYRTIEGFKVLLEKEWLAFGHRFTHRGNHIATTQSGFTPVFLQFLDAVHQIMRQFPLSFEFNDHFLCTLAYHHVSMRFRTFTMDSEHERNEAGWWNEDEAGPRGKDFWEYLDRCHRKLPTFYNFMFSPGQNKVLRPRCEVSNLKVWEWYVTENLSTGPTYDVEIINEIETTVEDQQSMESERHIYSRRCMTGCYGNVTQFSRDQCSALLLELSRLEEEHEEMQSPHAWQHVWHKLDYPTTRKLPLSPTAQWNKMQSLMLHKRGTMEIILRGKLQVEEKGAQGFSQPHNFQSYTFLKPTNCDCCCRTIFAVLDKGLKCLECGYNVHEKCQSQVPWQCRKPRDLREQGTMLAKSTTSLPESDAGGLLNKKLHCGHLHKRGRHLRQWKTRWFVLDTQRNQLRYYDSEQDAHPQGFIDLGDMIGVSACLAPPGAPKGSEKGAFFDIKTTKRVYNLAAECSAYAQEWIEKLQSMSG